MCALCDQNVNQNFTASAGVAREWLTDTFLYRFGGKPVLPWSFEAFSAGDVLRDTFQQVTEYVSSVLDVKFVESDQAFLTVSNGDLPGTTLGITYHSADRLQFKNDIVIEPSSSGSFGIVMHELAHVLGLDHVDTPGSLMRPTYPAEVWRIFDGFDNDSLLFLNSRFGSAAGNDQDWVGTAYDDKIFGGTGFADPYDNGETIWGNNGNDEIYGNGGDDTIFGGMGVVDPDADSDIIYCGIGDDVAYGNGGVDYLYGGPGNDTLYGGLGDDVIFARDGEVDTIIGGPGADQIFADPFDIILGDTTGDSILIS